VRAIVKSLALTAALFGLAFASPPARATLLLPGTSVVPLAQSDPLSGTTIAGNTGVQNFNITGADGSTFVGTGQAWAVTGFSGNPFGSSDVTFVYQVQLTGGTTALGAAQVIERVTASAFDAFSTDAGFHLQAVGQVAPATASRTSNGGIIAFNFSPEIPVGGTSTLLIVNTNAPTFVTGTMSVQDGLTANLQGFSPAAVPEPSSLAIAGIGALGLIGYRARRRLKKRL